MATLRLPFQQRQSSFFFYFYYYRPFFYSLPVLQWRPNKNRWPVVGHHAQTQGSRVSPNARSSNINKPSRHRRIADWRILHATVCATTRSAPELEWQKENQTNKAWHLWFFCVYVCWWSDCQQLLAVVSPPVSLIILYYCLAIVTWLRPSIVRLRNPKIRDNVASCVDSDIAGCTSVAAQYSYQRLALIGRQSGSSPPPFRLMPLSLSRPKAFYP